MSLPYQSELFFLPVVLWLCPPQGSQSESFGSQRNTEHQLSLNNPPGFFQTCPLFLLFGSSPVQSVSGNRQISSLDNQGLNTQRR
ncbi:unnamed protein product [Cyberlindnera jadinii]|uniref:Secreted protein n=1 Tax=Cyberlindnera jadinii (strain ATCC 18201 / CBS 1600 / BCRC 20928 / JCM 3617 / NBRC 0987 / NRRL Y-1542) TaxID=983966 RepID=A0A0H5C642_CYBJN|nr:unnamed protein product [Cyberlindnera jadinii]